MSPSSVLRWFASVAARECRTNGVLSWQPHLFIQSRCSGATQQTNMLMRDRSPALCQWGQIQKGRQLFSSSFNSAAYFNSEAMGFDPKRLFPSIGTIVCTAINVVALSKLTSVSTGASFRTLRRCCSFTPYQKTRETGVSSPCCLRK